MLQFLQFVWALPILDIPIMAKLFSAGVLIQA